MKTMGGGCLGGVIGALLGVVIGASIGFSIGSHSHAVGVHARVVDVFVGRIICTTLGVGIGGIIGGIGGSVMGAGLAATADESEPPTESPDAELARLKERVTELEAKKRGDDRFKEK